MVTPGGVPGYLGRFMGSKSGVIRRVTVVLTSYNSLNIT